MMNYKKIYYCLISILILILVQPIFLFRYFFIEKLGKNVIIAILFLHFP